MTETNQGTVIEVTEDQEVLLQDNLITEDQLIGSLEATQKNIDAMGDIEEGSS
jgi:hypothetical protein|tara:strand:+ start:192 stop:350 length:159 start_codon:yes stop_codon:yes gene_type:complete